MLSKKRLRDQRKQKRLRRALEDLKKKKKRASIRTIILFLCGVVGVGLAFGTNYYLRTNLSEQDTYNIVQSYYVLNQTEKLLTDINEADEETSKKGGNNFEVLSTRLSSYAAKRADVRISDEGQQSLNRYYASIGQLGVNLSSVGYVALEADSKLVADYLSDIKKADGYQKNVLTFFGINEASLQKKK